MEKTYVPGVCNIGDEEISRRRTTGWVGVVVAVVLFVALFWLGANPLWRLFVFFPAFLGATGFIQAHYGFCTGFARRGLFNFGEAGKTTAVTDDVSKAKDKKKGNRITLYSFLIAIIVALVCVLL